MQIYTHRPWGQRLAAVALVTSLSVAATVALMPLKPLAAQRVGAVPPLWHSASSRRDAAWAAGRA